MGMLDMTTYAQLQAADAMREAARNEGGGAGLTAGIGAGLGIGNVLSDSLKGYWLIAGGWRCDISRRRGARYASGDDPG